jgi:cell division protein FtsL
MLEIKPQPVDGTRRATHLSCPSSSSAPRPLPARTITWDRSESVHRADRAAERLRKLRMSRNETRLLTTIICCALALSSLLVVYLAAYARVTMLGIDQAQMRSVLRQKRQNNETLRAQLADLQSPDRIAAGAARLGLTRDAKRTDYIKPPSPQAQTADAYENAPTTVGESMAGSQGTASGPTSDDNSTNRND